MLGLHGLHNAFRGLPNVEVVAHVDSNPENIEQKISYTGAKKHYLSYLEMLDKEKPDIAVLCSRHPYDHFQEIKTAAERGINIYCEKPMTVSLEEADAIVSLAEKHHIKICMAHPARYALSFRTMKAMIETGEIGTPLTVYGRGKCDHRGGGEDLIVLGTHILDLQTFFFGAPEYVWADVAADGKPIVRTDRTKTVEPLGPVAGDNIYATELLHFWATGYSFCSAFHGSQSFCGLGPDAGNRRKSPAAFQSVQRPSGTGNDLRYLRLASFSKSNQFPIGRPEASVRRINLSLEPVVSMRMKLIREGMENLEYLFLLKTTQVPLVLIESVPSSTVLDSAETISDSYPIGCKLVEEHVDLLHIRIAEKINDEIMALQFPSPFNAEFLQTVGEFWVSHQIGGLQIGQTCPFNEI